MYRKHCSLILQITLPAAFDSNQPTISKETLKIKQANLTGEVLEASSRGRVASNTVTARSNYNFIFTNKHDKRTCLYAIL